MKTMALLIVINAFGILGCEKKATTKKETTPQPLSREMKQSNIPIPNQKTSFTDTLQGTVSQNSAKNSTTYLGLDWGKDQNNRYWLGSKNATTTITVYTDFQCPYCRKFHQTIVNILKKNKGKFKLILINMPLKFHNQARKRAKMALCAGELGKFWEGVDHIFTAPYRSKLPRLASTIGVDPAAFNTCLGSQKIEKIINDDISDAVSNKVRGTPSVFINGQKAQNWVKALKNL
jgi:protein-disulfide isomerase